MKKIQTKLISFIDKLKENKKNIITYYEKEISNLEKYLEDNIKPNMLDELYKGHRSDQYYNIEDKLISLVNQQKQKLEIIMMIISKMKNQS